MTRNGRNDIRLALLRAGLTLGEIGRLAVSEPDSRRSHPLTAQRVGQCIDDPNPRNGRHVKRVVARKLSRSIADLWPGPCPEASDAA